MSAKKRTYVEVGKLVTSAVCIALCYVLPFLTGQIPEIGGMLSPMHIPVFICGFICGPTYGAVVGAVSPLLRSLTLHMPPLLTALAMAFELAAYGLLTGLLYPLFVKILKKNTHLPAILVSMLIAMVLGRLVGGAAKACVMGIQGNEYGLQAFIAAYFTGTAVGAVIHLIVVPAVTIALEKARLSPSHLD